jgi:hypothetical protein
MVTIMALARRTATAIADDAGAKDQPAKAKRKKLKQEVGVGT